MEIMALIDSGIYHELQVMVDTTTIYFLGLKFRFSEKATKIWLNRPQGFDVT